MSFFKPKNHINGESRHIQVRYGMALRELILNDQKRKRHVNHAVMLTRYVGLYSFTYRITWSFSIPAVSSEIRCVSLSIGIE